MTVSATPAVNKPQPMLVLVKGKIDAFRRYDKKVFTRIITPAPDAYSRPQIIEVRSNSKLGERDEEITLSAILGGFQRKPFRLTDKETGEVSTITPVDMTLDVVE